MANRDRFPFKPKRNYSYTAEFEDMFSDHSPLPSEIFSKKASLFSSSLKKNSKVIINIKSLAQTCKAGELAYLREFFGINYEPKNWEELIRGFNLLYSTEKAFERNLQLLEQVANGDSKIYTQLETYFSSYLDSAIEEALMNAPINQIYYRGRVDESKMRKLIDDVVKEAIKKMYSARDYRDSNGAIITNPTDGQSKELEAIQAYSELLKIIDTLQSNAFFAPIRDFFDLENHLKKAIKEERKNRRRKKRKKLPKVKTTIQNGSNKGEIAELFGALIAEANLKGITFSDGIFDYTFETHHTGGYGVKSDVMQLAVVGVETTDLENVGYAGESNSNRVNQIRQYRKAFEKLKEAHGHIVFISNKNYNINADFKGRGGFLAQEKTTLENVGALLREVGSPVKVDNLIDVLSNCGERMVLGDPPDDVLKVVATQIGHFLFDDLSITVPTGINTVHLFNLSGIYIPMSVFLEGVYHSIMSAEQNMDSFVRVNFKGGEPTSGEGYRPWGNDYYQFQRFRDDKIKNSYITVHFMRDFADFITENVKV